MRRAASVPPELVGFEYQRLLGAGGFSDVFLYQQRLPRRPVAVKVLLTEESTPASQRAFVDEANLMAQLSAHPYIVTIYGADLTDDQRPYFVMEYCSGPSLSEQYKRAPFGVADALRTGIRLSSAIATAHHAGILHRDIKPANVLTNDYGWPALTDFGISSTVDELPVMTTTAGALRRETESTGGTESQSVGMSVPWSPPEMFDDDPEPDVRSDVFSLAATIWTLLAGRTPFEVPGRSNGSLDLIGRIERGRVTPMGRDDVPRSLLATLQKGMATRRLDRYASAVEFARALQRVELELGYAATAIEVPTLTRDATSAAPDASADETRVRGVATIAAQPAVVRPQIRPARDGVSDGGDATRIRGAVPVRTPGAVDEGTVIRPSRAATAVREPEAGPDAGAGADPSAALPPRSPLVRTIAIAVGTLVVAGVAVSLVATGALRSADPAPTPTTRGTSAIDGFVPSPRFLSSTPSTDGASVTFTFAAVDGADGYRWAPSEQPESTRPLEEPIVTRTGVAPGARVCVRIIAVRDGATSQAREACYPP